MVAIVEAESRLTERYQTTVPETVRRALSLGKRDKIRFTIRADGDVVLTRALATASDDPVVAKFLEFLARDITEHPKRLAHMDAGFAQRIQKLVGDQTVDLDAALLADDE